MVGKAGQRVRAFTVTSGATKLNPLTYEKSARQIYQTAPRHTVSRTIDALKHTAEYMQSVMSCKFVEDILALLKEIAAAMAKVYAMTAGLI